MRILIVEDNRDIAANLGDFLSDRDHEVDYAYDGPTGLNLAKTHPFDALVLDLSLPGMDGLEVARQLRQEAKIDIPILMLTARDQLEDKLAGFDSGADDYLVKPFELKEVEARIEVLARRGQRIKPESLVVGDLEYNLETYRVTRSGQSIELNPIGLKLLEKLMSESPAVVSRRELEHHVWGEELPDSDSLRVHIHSLRTAIDKPFDQGMIQTRHGIGYSLVAPDEVSASS
ncbi:MAG: response regulator transcription factor [Wenzhouxiangella sp.]|jgi:DNA-binding response OmpR family regulator|nr:response regulator transcription factor [Wenzhouxiangella sp.]MDR9453109.1 response regulator transcription factor [Wenzhouxiangella sp.]